ncbi:MAG: hypothetical protein HRU40_16140, partial [Saprospiraceae bacterium]|nr:hypothetical protein [Saprospiraceae bacterium]
CVVDLTVGLSTGGFARVFTNDISEGSFDACSEVNLQVRRVVPDDCIGFFLINGYDLNGDNRLNEEDGFLQDGNTLYMPWAESVPFFCCDLDQKVRVELWVADENGNSSICWSNVSVEDKRPPLCRPPNPFEVNCLDERIGDWSAFGSATILQNDCGNMTLVELPLEENLDDCGLGEVIRSFQTIRDLGLPNEKRSPICQQTITIIPNHQYTLCFPEDVASSCGDDPFIPGLEQVDDGCDLTAVAIEDEIFYATKEPGVCYKIFRTYRVINWCSYNGEMEPVVISRDWDAWNGTNPQEPNGNGNPGDQGICVIVQRNFSDRLPDTVWYDVDMDPLNDLPEHQQSGAEDGYFWRVISGNANPESNIYYSGNGTVWGNNPNNPNTNPTTGQPGYGSNGFWQYTQHISVQDIDAPDIDLLTEKDTFLALSNSDCSAEVSLQFQIGDACNLSWEDYSFESALDLFSNNEMDESPFIDVALFPKILISGRYPIGQHTFYLTVNDGCGNTSTITSSFWVVDRKAPTPICINGLSVTLMPTEPGDSIGPGAIPIFVDNFLASDLTDCSGDISYAINFKGQPFDPSQDGIVLSCSDQGTVVIDIFAWDNAGNIGSCETYVLVQDNGERLCRSEEMGSISGLITTPDMVPVADVDITLSGPFSRNQATGPDGLFGFYDLEPGYDYSVSPVLDRDYNNGVTTYDLYLIQQHILRRTLFTEPYQYVAADANRSGYISVSDMVQIRKLILHVELDLSNNTSWRFLPGHLQFDDPELAIRPGFTSIFNADNLPADSLIADYWAVKVGDLSGDAIANSEQLETRSLHVPWPILVENQWLEAGETYHIPLYNTHAVPLVSRQMAFHADPQKLRFLGLSPDFSSAAEWILHADANVLAYSSLPSGTEEVDSLPFCVLEVVPQVSGYISDWLRLSDRWVPGEMADEEGQFGVPQLLFTEVNKSSPTNLRVYPNPTQGPVTVSLELPEKMPTQIMLMDVSGRLIWSQIKNVGPGLHHWEFTLTDFPGSGWYQILVAQNEQVWRQTLILQ